MKLVENAREVSRSATVVLHSAVLLLLSLYEIMPALSPQIADMLPQHLQVQAIGIYALIGVALRLIKFRG